MRASKTKNNEANLKKGQYFQYIVSKLSKTEPLSNVDVKTNLINLNSIRNKKNKGSKKLKPISITKNVQKPFELPKNWMWLTLKDVVKLTDNLNIQSKLKSDEIINYVDISCIDNNEFKIKEVKESSVSELSSRARRVLKKDFFLYSLVRPYLNNMAIVTDEKKLMIGSTGFSVFDSFYLRNEFLKYWFLSPFIKDYYNELISGFNSPSISMNQFLETPVPVAPIEEQNLILSFFEAMDSNKKEGINSLPNELVSGIIELDKLQNYSVSLFKNIDNRKLLIPQLKQAILQEAIQGKLTADWRARHPELVSGSHSASELLKRIKAEKAQLIKAKKLKKGNTAKHPLSLIKDLSIPINWNWVKADEVLFTTKLAGFEYSKHISLQPIGDVPVIRAQNVRPINITKKNLLYINKKTSYLLNRCALTKECLLVTFIGAGIGDVATFNEVKRWHLAPNVAKMEPFIGCEDLLNIKYLNYFLLSNIGRKEIFKHMKATAQPSLSMTTIRDIDFPIPPLSEQKEIVKKVELLMEKCQQLEQEITKSEANAQMLMQAVLKEAFSEKEKQ